MNDPRPPLLLADCLTDVARRDGAAADAAMARWQGTSRARFASRHDAYRHALARATRAATDAARRAAAGPSPATTRPGPP